MVLHITAGIPGSGKSTLCWNFIRNKYNTTILEPDAFRYEMTGTYHFPALEDYVWATVRMSARVLLKSDQNVIIDATALTRRRRSEWVHLAKECEVACYCWAMVTSEDRCREQNQKRNRVVPDNVLKRQISQYTIPTVDEGFHQIHLMNPGVEAFQTVGFHMRSQEFSSGFFKELTGKVYYSEEISSELISP